jgi:hypothetical protein
LGWEGRREPLEYKAWRTALATKLTEGTLHTCVPEKEATRKEGKGGKVKGFVQTYIQNIFVETPLFVLIFDIPEVPFDLIFVVVG